MAVSRSHTGRPYARKKKAPLTVAKGLGVQVKCMPDESGDQETSRSGHWAFGVPGARMEGLDDGRDSATRTEVADDLGPDGIGGFDNVVENLVDDVLLKDAQVAIGEEIFLEGLEFHA